MRQLGVILQESLRRGGESRTILDLFTEQMEGGVDREPRRRTLKERLRFTGIGCCGATWGFRPAPISVEHEEEEEGQRQEQQPLQEANSGLASNSSYPECMVPVPSSSSMNLAAALAAERQHRGSQEPDVGTGTMGPTNNGSGGQSGGTVPGTPWRVSLMRLLEETDVADMAEVTEREKGGVLGSDSVCCVCMVRKKGAAYIPCGHTFCRVCSRELWLNRGCCPLCNRSILEILDIF